MANKTMTFGSSTAGSGVNIKINGTLDYGYAVCNTAAATAAKTVDMTNFELITGATVHIKFTYANTVASPTLNINSTGAKYIVNYGTSKVGTSTTSAWATGAVVQLTYDGTYWVRNQGYNINTTYSTMPATELSEGTATTGRLVTAAQLAGFLPKTGGTVTGSLTVTGELTADKVYGAVWNDYAEYRQANSIEPGRCIVENGDDTLSLSERRLQKGCEIISDTFGFAIGQTENCQTPVAVGGRVLAFVDGPRELYKEHIGDFVCSAPNGTVSLMTDEEARLYPACIIGTVSAVPSYDTWGSNNIAVNDRVWIRIK